MKPAAALAALLLAAVLLGACGDSADHGPGMTTGQGMGGPSAPPGARSTRCAMKVAGAEGMRVAGMSCHRAAAALGAWKPGRCLPAAGGSRAGCRAGRFRCAAVATARGYSVSCAAPGRSIAFTAPRR